MSRLNRRKELDKSYVVWLGVGINFMFKPNTDFAMKGSRLSGVRS